MSHDLARDQRRSGRGTIEGRQRRRMRPTLMALEDRRLLATFTVNNTLDDGSAGSLRWAVSQANSTGGDDTIDFDTGVFATPQKITLLQDNIQLTDTTGTETIIGPAAGLTVTGNGGTRLFWVFGGVTASISDVTIAGGISAGDGGGVLNQGTLTLSYCTVRDNWAANISSTGGGIYNQGALTLFACVLHDNNATVDGGGIFNQGTATITDSTLYGNSAQYKGGPNNTISNGGGIENQGTLTVTNSTLYGNFSNNDGGGIDSKGTLTLSECTLDDNLATKGAGGGLNISGGTVTIGNTIVAQNSAGTSGPDASGTFASQGHNLIGATDGSSGWVGADLTGTIAQPLDPLLAPLNYYGGPTQTIYLLPGSPAIDAGNNALIPTGVTIDQRGSDRIVNGTVDIGAFEFDSNPLVVNTTADGRLSKLDLRGAVGQASVRSGDQTITFDPTVFASVQTITLRIGPIELSDTSKALTITGPAAGVTVSGNNAYRVFQVDPGVTASISGLTITEGGATVTDIHRDRGHGRRRRLQPRHTHADQLHSQR